MGSRGESVRDRHGAGENTVPLISKTVSWVRKSQTPRWDFRPAARLVLERTALARLALDGGH
jgi:hypothetical protein